MVTVNNRSITLLVMTIGIILLMVANLVYGSVNLSWEELSSILTAGDDSSVAWIIVWQYRLPQTLTALAVGVALSVAGLILQTTFNNPLAGPSVLGISSGASFGVALVLLAGGPVAALSIGSQWFVQNLIMVGAAFAGATAVLMLIIYISSRIGNVVTILIIGIMIGYLVNAAVGTMQFYSSSRDLQAYVLWGLGSFSKTSVGQAWFLLALVMLVSGVSLLYVKPLNALLLGENYARSSGVDTRRINRHLITVAGILIALGTAFTGPIAFLGLAVPHLTRMLFITSNHRLLLPAVMLMGGILSLICNLIARMPGWEASLPINAVTSVIGAPLVIWVILKGRSHGL